MLTDGQPPDLPEPSWRILALSKTVALIVTAAISILLLIVLFRATFDMMPSLLPGYPGDAFFPRWVLGFTSFFAVMILLTHVQRYLLSKADSSDKDVILLRWTELLAVGVLATVYIVLMPRIGFELATFGFLALLLFPRSIRPWPQALVFTVTTSLVTTLILYLVFAVALNVGVPLQLFPARLF